MEPNAPVRRAWAITRACDIRSAAADAMLEILEEQARRLAGGFEGSSLR